MQTKPVSVNLFIAGLWLFVQATFAQMVKANVLVFNKTVKFRNESSEAGNKALDQLATEKGFGVVFTEDASHFKEAI